MQKTYMYNDEIQIAYIYMDIKIKYRIGNIFKNLYEKKNTKCHF